MRKFLAVGLVLACSVAGAQDIPGTTRLWQETQILTRADPSAVTDGVTLANVIGVRVTVCAENTRTLTGGTLRVWLYDNDTALWGRNSSLDLTVAANSLRCQTFPDVVTTVSTGRLLIAANAVTVSAGTTVTVTVKMWTSRVAR